MIRISLNRKVRPLRLAFLLEPLNRSQLLRALRINTILWGGRFNPLIPVYRRTPLRWETKPLKPPTAKDILDGYLRAFDPDFVVDMTGREIRPVGYESVGSLDKRILKPDEVIDLKADDPVSYGTDVMEIYEHLYLEEFRFERQNPPRVVLPETSDREMELLIAACFGSFPQEKELKHLQEGYIKAFKAETLDVTPADFHEMFTPATAFPLRIGSAYLQYGSQGIGSESATLRANSVSHSTGNRGL